MHKKHVVYKHSIALGVTAMLLAIIVVVGKNQSMFSPIPTNTVTQSGVEYLQRKQVTNIIRQTKNSTILSVHTAAQDVPSERSILRWFLVTP